MTTISNPNLVFTAALALICLAGCGSDDSKSPGSGSGAAAGSTAGGGGSGGSGGSAGSGGSGAVGGAGGSGSTSGAAGAGGSAGTGTTVNGCSSATAEDHLADQNVDVHFPGSVPYSFTPRCIRVSSGATVTFRVDAGLTFHDHAIYGGTTVDGTGPLDPGSPIGPKDSTDSDPLVVTLSSAGAFGYYCPYHGYLGETGAVFVE